VVVGGEVCRVYGATEPAYELDLGHPKRPRLWPRAARPRSTSFRISIKGACAGGEREEA
jgi:hypothetical protein